MSLPSESYLVGLIGSGITASLTPPLHEREADRQGLRYLYRPVDLDVVGRPGADVGDLLRAGRDLGFNAFNITHPCKQLVIAHLDELSPAARRLDAVNTVLVRDGRLVGDNTDCSGFAWGLRTGLPGAALGTAVQLGAGGAGGAVAYALLDAGVRTLRISDVVADRAAERAQALGALFPDRTVEAIAPDDVTAALRTADGLVNATPIGMHHHPGLPLDADAVHGRLWVADVIYRPVETALLRLAAARGCRVLDGGHMAVGQAVDAFRLITGAEADVAAMRADFLALVAAEAAGTATAAGTRAPATAEAGR